MTTKINSIEPFLTAIRETPAPAVKMCDPPDDIYAELPAKMAELIDNVNRLMVEVRELKKAVRAITGMQGGCYDDLH